MPMYIFDMCTVAGKRCLRFASADLGELSLCLPMWNSFLIRVSFLCMKRIFSTYTTEHVCIARRFFGLVGLLLSIQLFIALGLKGR